MALSLFLAVYYVMSRKPRSWQNYLYLSMLINGILSAALDLANNVLEAYDVFHTPAGRDMIFAVNMLYFFIHIMLPALFARYIMHVIGLTANSNTYYRLRFFLFLIIGELVLLTNPYTHMVFTIDEHFRFTRGPLEYVLYGIGMLYFVMAFAVIVQYHKALRKHVLRAMLIYYTIIVAGALVQLLIPAYPTELFFEAVACIGYLLTFEEDDAMIDEITHLYNKTGFRWDNIRLLATKRVYYIINIKITNLKFYSRIMNVDGYVRMLESIGEWVGKLKPNGGAYHFDDNYALILYNTSEEQIKKLIGEISDMLEKAWYFDELEAHFRVFISVAKVPEDFDTIDSVFDMVEYDTTSESEHVVVQYRESLSLVKREAAVERALRKAIMNRSFQVYYQPIYNCETERISCAEALVRLFDDELGQIPPSEFIPIAEKSAMIVEIGDIIFEKVCRFIRDHKPSITGVEYIEINLSIAQFMFTGLVDRFSELIRTYGVRPSAINLEITESVASDSSESFMRAVRELSAMGFTFSMDDYGTGYSNISSILNVDFKNIKMDKIFLTKALSSRESATILKDTVSLIRHLHRNVLQEGVETLEELNLVREAGCNLVQGYFFSQPLPEADFMEYVRSLNQVAAV